MFVNKLFDAFVNKILWIVVFAEQGFEKLHFLMKRYPRGGQSENSKKQTVHQTLFIAFRNEALKISVDYVWFKKYS